MAACVDGLCPRRSFNRQSSYYVGAPAARGSMRGGTENPFVVNGHSLELVHVHGHDLFPICSSRGNQNFVLHQDSLDPPSDHHTSCLLPLPSSTLVTWRLPPRVQARLAEMESPPIFHIHLGFFRR